MMEEETPIQQTPPALHPRKRILAISVRGDLVWRMSLPVLNWMIEHGNQELSLKALNTRAYWEQEQGWFIDWGNNVRYFELAELACRDLQTFQQAAKNIPADNEGTKRIIELALLTGREFHKPLGLGWRQLNQKKKHGRGRKHR
ncbi:MAG TPA: hypothetical protein VFN23_04800 [Ktedonobacteraceae bacterium]|nr:hypothetical protein [Ktedonobacteraceae bacterium]